MIPKFCGTVSEVHGIPTQKTVPFRVTAVNTSNSTIRLGILSLCMLASSYKQNQKIEAVKHTVASVLKCPTLQKYFFQIAAVLSAHC